MTHCEAITLLDNPALHHRPTDTPTRWADLGCGTGTFTLALAHFLSPGSTIEAIDLAPGIKKQTTPNHITIHPRAADFTKPNLGLENIDGILMANAIHYVKDKLTLLQTLHASLKPGGLFLLVEYDTDIPLPRWVPYPISFTAASHLFTPPHWQTLQKSTERPSAFGRSNLYCAFTTKI
ncbi:MAG TPA: class I SAM-dependent methyltransferase [Puia sp.]|nr:class I SAM-dependent methyltransferase [Puia sp.]